MADEKPGVSDEGSPKIFKSINGWIAGLTGTVIALGGLTAAYREFFDKPSEAAVEATAPTGNETEEAVPVDETAEAEAPALPEKYESGSLTLEWDGTDWVETSPEGKVTRFRQRSRDDEETYAVDPANDMVIRWRNAGGELQQSTDGEVSWSERYSVSLPE
jgi:hypothetical protein